MIFGRGGNQNGRDQNSGPWSYRMRKNHEEEDREDQIPTLPDFFYSDFKI